ncbi:hypothetical protein [Verrucomicrobium sp. BvORR034]|uniref:hypothetical protein n=1 Tax=Verrucomicrobium sp. BvORR034 TaxID=1396418 RepID=UPI0006791E43|nr:hypothetical protein [Verrucomicrobium sp. BvORR034]
MVTTQKVTPLGAIVAYTFGIASGMNATAKVSPHSDHSSQTVLSMQDQLALCGWGLAAIVSITTWLLNSHAEKRTQS